MSREGGTWSFNYEIRSKETNIVSETVKSWFKTRPLTDDEFKKNRWFRIINWYYH